MYQYNWIKKDRDWSEYPTGTMAKALMGGFWMKTERGWQWLAEYGTFPTPGGDASGEVCLPPATQPPSALDNHPKLTPEEIAKRKDAINWYRNPAGAAVEEDSGKCPECGGLNGGHGNRFCSRMTLAYAQQEIINTEQKWIAVNAMSGGNYQRMRDRLKKLITFWCGKAAMLKEENNKLRSKLYSKAGAASTTQEAVSTDKPETVFVPCAEDDPRQCGGYTSNDGQSLCHVRETKVPVVMQGAVWISSEERLPEITRQPKLFIVKWFDDRMYVRTMTSGQLTDLAKNSVLEYFWLDEIGSQRQQAGPGWVKGDYDRLYNLLKAGVERPIACFVDYNYDWQRPDAVMRDICSIRSGHMEFSARGIGYGGAKYVDAAYEKNEFLQECERLNVEWLDEGQTSTTPKESDAVDPMEFAEWLADNTEIIREEKITIYRYCDKMNEWGNYILEDIYHVFKQSK